MVGTNSVSYSQRKTFLALYNEFCPSDPVKLANDRSAASRASNELDSYFEVGVEYCLIGHEVHISGEAARSTKGPKEQSEPWFAVADAWAPPASTPHFTDFASI